MNYINLKKKRFVGRNNQPIFNQFIIDYSTVEDVSFQIIDDKNQIQEITDTEGLYFAGSVGIGKQSYELLFLSKDYKVVDNIITFKVDTYTINYLNYIKKKNTEINIEIGQESLNVKKVILRDFALACPRVYVTGLAPQEIESKNYYTKTEVDELIKDVDIPTKVSELQNDSGFITGYVETDPVFSATSGQFELKSEAFDGDYNSLTNKPTIPTKVSELQNDSGYITGYVETDPVFSATSGQFELKSEAFNGDYNSLTNKPNIPSKTSELTNDAGYITGYVETDPVYTAEKPTLALKSELPTKVSELENDTGYITGYVENDPIFSSVSGTLATKTYVDKAIPDISDMISANGSFLDVGSFNNDGITPKFETSVIGSNINIIGVNNVYIFGSSLNFCKFNNGSPLLTVSSSDFKYKTDYDIERMKRANANNFTFESYAYLTLTSPITSINYSLPNGTLNNAVLQFTTGDTVEFTITGSSSYKINKPFEFEPNTSYIIYVDVYDIFWCKLHNFNQ